MIKKFEEIIKPLMSEKRFIHCLNVSQTAVELAKKYGADPEKARIAGILHDITKERTPEQQWNMAKRFDIYVTPFEESCIKLMHSKTGSAYVETVLGIRDGDILNAIKYHTTGRAGMSRLEKVIFLADFISKERDYKGVEEIRALARSSLEQGFLGGIIYTIKHLAGDETPIHSDTIAAYNETAFRKGKNNK